MPTYDYICTKCSHAWELEQRIIEDPVRKCPKCGANTAKRQISSGAGFILKGGGWYADGYGSKKSSSDASKSDDKAAAGESKTEKTEKAPSTPDKSTPDKSTPDKKTESKAAGADGKDAGAKTKTEGKVSAA
jgi:putative FmdB family regulatory protein